MKNKRLNDLLLFVIGVMLFYSCASDGSKEYLIPGVYLIDKDDSNYTYFKDSFQLDDIELHFLSDHNYFAVGSIIDENLKKGKWEVVDTEDNVLIELSNSSGSSIQFGFQDKKNIYLPAVFFRKEYKSWGRYFHLIKTQ